MKQLELFDAGPANRCSQHCCPPGWERIRSGLDSLYQKKGTEWWVMRAPHPTALWPWYGFWRFERPQVLALSGRGFAHLLDCIAEVERRAAAGAIE